MEGDRSLMMGGMRGGGWGHWRELGWGLHSGRTSEREWEGGKGGQGVATGKLKHRESIANGLAAAPEAFLGLLKGKNFGKQLVKLI